MSSLVLIFGAASVLVSTPNVILTSDAKQTRWCAFDSVAFASVRAEADSSPTVVNAWTSGDEIVDLKILWAPQSRAWLVTDSYSVDGRKVVTVERELAEAATDKRVRETFTRQGDSFTVTRKDEAGGPHPETAPFADLDRAPFYPLLTRAMAQGDLPDSGLCTSAPRQARR